jgi:hypothetical protein
MVAHSLSRRGQQLRGIIRPVLLEETVMKATSIGISCLTLLAALS